MPPPKRQPHLESAFENGRRAAARYRLIVPREAMRGAAGTRAGQLSGASLDFRDYREYEPGDDLRHIDWNVCARTERYVVKLFREEVTPHLDIVLDASRSMDLPDTGKAAAAVHLAALLAGSAANASCTWTVWHAAAACNAAAGDPPRPPEFTSAGSPASGLAAASPSLRRNGMRVWISDLLWPEDPLRSLLPLAERAAALHVIQVLAATEATPADMGNRRIRDVETGGIRDLHVDATTLERYRAGLRAHRDLWRDACRRCGARFSTLTDDDVGREDGLEPLQRSGLIE